jgi:hypothetical protein
MTPYKLEMCEEGAFISSAVMMVHWGLCSLGLCRCSCYVRGGDAGWRFTDFAHFADFVSVRPRVK